MAELKTCKSSNFSTYHTSCLFCIIFAFSLFKIWTKCACSETVFVHVPSPKVQKTCLSGSASSTWVKKITSDQDIFFFNTGPVRDKKRAKSKLGLLHDYLLFCQTLWGKVSKLFSKLRGFFTKKKKFFFSPQIQCCFGLIYL